MNRFGCLLVDHFAAAAHARCEPDLRDRPLAVVTGTPPARRIVEASDAARAAGVVPGMTETEARARCVALAVRAVSDERATLAQHALLEAALGVSPRVEDGGPGIVSVDLAGLARLLGDDGRIAERLVRAARGVGLDATVGVAGTRTAARIAGLSIMGGLTKPPKPPALGSAAGDPRRSSGLRAARSADAFTGPEPAETSIASRCHVVPPGCERDALGAVPLAVLDLAPPLAETFARWGVVTLGELAALPRDGLGTRLGRAGLDAQDEALGHDRTAFRPWSPPPFWQEAQGLDWEVDTWSGLEPMLRQLLERLTARLAAGHVSADTLRLELALASGAHDVRTVALASPSCDPRPMLVLVALELEARPPSAPVTRVAVSARAVRAEAAQARLGERPGPALRDLTETLVRLATLVGRDNVGSPVILDSHRADPVTLVPFAPPRVADSVRANNRPPGGRLLLELSDDDAWRDGDDGEVPVWDGDGDATVPSTSGADADAGAPRSLPTMPLAFRRVRPPRRVDVTLVDDAPVQVAFHDALGGVSRPQAIVASAGPWRTSGEWWTTNGWAREEWDVALADGMLCRLARDRMTGEWYLDGAYD
ncbi:MAG: DNA polymerase Y family protein [Candidatus Rokubacteria bacterium]|nr:DNA polymerase Y family protein [Candidatus Rokubacteria bacterium]